MVTLLFFSAERFSLLSALLKASIKAWNLSVGYSSNLLCISKHLANTKPSALFYLCWLQSKEKQSLVSLNAKLPDKDPYQRTGMSTRVRSLFPLDIGVKDAFTCWKYSRNIHH